MDKILGDRGTLLITSFEQLKMVSYLPTPEDVPTIGWGHTKDVKLGMSCTIGQARKWFDEDTAEAIAAVQKLKCNLTQSMFDALCSLVYNVGSEAISSESTIGKALASTDYFAAWAGFSLWRKQNKKNLLGLARRRAKEMVLFLEDGVLQ